MAYTFNGTTQYLEVAVGFNDTAPCSISAISTVDSASANTRTFSSYHTSGNNSYVLDILNGSNVGERAYWERPTYGTSSIRKGSDGTSGIWLAMAAGWSAYTSAPTLYSNGSSITNSPTSGSAGGSGTYSRVGMGSLVYGGIRYYGTGNAAECAIWSSELSVQDLIAVSLKFTPILVSPTTLEFHFPLGGALSSPLLDVVGQNNLTATGSPSIVEHPPVIYPSETLCC